MKIVLQKYYSSFILWILIVCSFPQNSFAQQNTDSINSSGTEEMTHSVKRATVLSASFPGLGQIYNKKYWKLPIVYGAMGTTIYFAIDNHRQYRRYLDAFYIRIDEDPNTVDEFEGIYTEESQLIELQDYFRKYRDFNIILTGFVYALQIIDAHVDAHLFYYNVDDNLSLQWEPSIIRGPHYNSFGLGVKLNFK